MRESVRKEIFKTTLPLSSLIVDSNNEPIVIKQYDSKHYDICACLLIPRSADAHNSIFRECLTPFFSKAESSAMGGTSRLLL